LTKGSRKFLFATLHGLPFTLTKRLDPLATRSGNALEGLLRKTLLDGKALVAVRAHERRRRGEQQ
jgi:hypothetical protein